MLHDHTCFPPRFSSHRAILAVALATLGASAGLATPVATAANRSVAVIVVPAFTPESYADRGAIGLFVPGAGATISRERALASLVRGRVVSSLVKLDGDVVVWNLEPVGDHLGERRVGALAVR